jgi:hypothetical protein
MILDRLDIVFFRRILRTALSLVWLCGLSMTVSAEKMETAIQEAIYIFEMNG